MNLRRFDLNTNYSLTARSAHKKISSVITWVLFQLAINRVSSFSLPQRIFSMY